MDAKRMAASAAPPPPPTTTFGAMFAAPVTIAGLIVYIVLSGLTIVAYILATRKVASGKAASKPHVPAALADDTKAPSSVTVGTLAQQAAVSATAATADAPSAPSEGATVIVDAPAAPAATDATSVVITEIEPPPAVPDVPAEAPAPPAEAAAPPDMGARILSFLRSSSAETAQDGRACMRALGIAAGGTAALSFGLVAAWCIAGDTLQLWSHAGKVTGGLLSFDAFTCVCLLGLAFALILSQTAAVAGEDADALMNQRVCEELKGWAMLAFLFYHYFGTRQVYNLMRILVSAYVFLTGYGNTLSLSVAATPSYPSWNKFAGAYLRINLLVTLIAAAMGTPYMLYYICMLHTFWTAVTYLLHMRSAAPPASGDYALVPTATPGDGVAVAVAAAGLGGLSPLTLKLLRYLIAFVAVTLVWHVKPLWDALFWVTTPVTAMDDSMHEWWFRSKLDAYSALAGCVFAELREPIRDALKGREGFPLALRVTVTLICAAILLAYCLVGLPLADKLLYNAWHPYIAWAPIIAFMVLRGAATWLRRTYSGVFAFLGRHSLELYLLQFHMWLGASAKSNILLLPSMRITSSVVHTALFLTLAVATFASTNAVLAALRTHTRTQACVCVLSVFVIAVVTLSSNARYASASHGTGGVHAAERMLWA